MYPYPLNDQDRNLRQRSFVKTLISSLASTTSQMEHSIDLLPQGKGMNRFWVSQKIPAQLLCFNFSQSELKDAMILIT